MCQPGTDAAKMIFHIPVNFLYRRKHSHLSRGFTSYCTFSLSSKMSVCGCKAPALFLLRDGAAVATENSVAGLSSHFLTISRSASDSSVGACVGDLMAGDCAATGFFTPFILGFAGALAFTGPACLMLAIADFASEVGLDVVSDANAVETGEGDARRAWPFLSERPQASIIHMRPWPVNARGDDGRCDCWWQERRAKGWKCRKAPSACLDALAACLS